MDCDTSNKPPQESHHIQLSRVWEMPNKYTFKMKAVSQLLNKYQVGDNWVDPFAGLYSPAQITNDIRPLNTTYNMDALEFLKQLPDCTYTGVLFDPPYSVEQCLRKYTPKYKGTAGRAEYWAKCKDEIARIVKGNGLTISFAWDSTGMGKVRRFRLIELVVVCHGACHNDTLITVEIKDRYRQFEEDN